MWIERFSKACEPTCIFGARTVAVQLTGASPHEYSNGIGLGIVVRLNAVLCPGKPAGKLISLEETM